MSKIRIKSIWLDGACCDKNGMGMALNVDFDNGSSIMFLLDSIADRPLFRDVVMNRVREPQTDGERVYWDNGACLTIPDMMGLLQNEKKAGA